MSGKSSGRQLATMTKLRRGPISQGYHEFQGPSENRGHGLKRTWRLGTEGHWSRGKESAEISWGQVSRGPSCLIDQGSRRPCFLVIKGPMAMASMLSGPTRTHGLPIPCWHGPKGPGCADCNGAGGALKPSCMRFSGSLGPGQLGCR